MKAQKPIPCPDCRYDLRGLIHAKGAMCPECGVRLSAKEVGQITAPRNPIWIPIGLLTTPLVMLASYVPAMAIHPTALRAAIPLIVGIGWAFWFSRRPASRFAAWLRTPVQPEAWVAPVIRVALSVGVVFAWIVALLALLPVILWGARRLD